jgi:hypothetical protein
MKHFSDFGLTPLMAVIDIETLDTKPSAVIASIGCVVVNVFTGEFVSEFYERCEIVHQSTTLGRTKSQSTIDWWDKQAVDCLPAYQEVFDKGFKRDKLYNVLPRLNDFLTNTFDGNRVQLMGNGPEFDNAALNHAMEQFNIKPAWDYGANQSLRTIVWMGRMLMGIDPKYTLELQDGEVKHHALHDARHEAKYLCAVFQSFAAKIHPQTPNMDWKPIPDDLRELPLDDHFLGWCVDNEDWYYCAYEFDDGGHIVFRSCNDGKWLIAKDEGLNITNYMAIETP